MFVLVPDGFYEWENPEGEDFGLARLEKVIRESCDYYADLVHLSLTTAFLSLPAAAQRPV